MSINSISCSRLIPVILIKNGLIVRSQNFKIHQVIGNPISTIKRLSEWNVDEIITLDISEQEDFHDLRRDDLVQNYNGNKIFDVLKSISKVCFVPLTFGGKIESLGDIEKRFELGTDRVVINSAGFNNPHLLYEASKKFGSQSIVAGIDLKKEKGNWSIYINNGKKKVNIKLFDWLKHLKGFGVGEIFINSIDKDGNADGFELDLIEMIEKISSLPVIFCGGAGNENHFIEAMKYTKHNSIAAANIFHFKELSYPIIKKKLVDNNLHFRPSTLESTFIRRLPKYSKNEAKKKIQNTIIKSKRLNKAYNNKNLRKKIIWCEECVYPSISAAPLEFNEKGVCTGCQTSKIKHKIKAKDWLNRKNTLKRIIDQSKKKNESDYDCIIAVSGGKDSYYQVHVIKEEFKLNPLLVTYDANNWTDVGWRNMIQMKEVFDCDHLLVRPSVSILKKLNRICFYVMGDMNWHAHVGIMTQPMSIAVKFKIPLVFYGEHGYLDLSGQFSMDDFPEVTYRDRLEHFARGYEWNYFLGVEGIESQDMSTWKYPDDKEILDLNLRGLFLGNYIKWEANEHFKLVKSKYNFQESDLSFDRTYRKMSNLDDMHENGIHDYLKYIKFGYGRASDHVTKDIRAGLMTREQGKKIIKKYDHVKPSDLKRWLKYVDMEEKTFDKIADTFRDKRVWYKEQNIWKKQEI